MDFDEALSKAAHKAAQATNRAMRKYAAGLVTDEDDLTGVLVGNLDSDLTGVISGLKWSTSILRHRAGVAAEEKAIGADLVIHVTLRTRKRRYSKGVLIQAKRFDPGGLMSTSEQADLIKQCDKMLAVTPSAFVFDYARGHMRCGSATRISGSSERDLYSDCNWTSYRFFLELFRCPVGDPKLTSARVRDLPVPTALEVQASGD